MALKGVIQTPGGGTGGQLSGSGVTSVALSGPAPFITGPPVTSAGTLTFDFSGTAIPVADGGTGATSFTSNAVVITGPSSTAPLTSIVLPQQSSEFLNGLGVFSVPAGGGGPGGGVSSVDLSLSSEFRISGNPVTSAGTLTAGFIQPLNVAHGGTGFGSFAANSVIRAGLTSTGPFQSTALTNLGSTFLDGTGNFNVPPYPTGAGAGTVTSVDLSLSSEFRISGNPITGAGTLVAGFIQPLNVAHGGTGMGSFGLGVVMGGLTSSGPLQGLPLNNLTSNFLRGDGVFAAPPPPPAGGTGTVTSVDLALSSEFTVSGNPITTSGQLVVGWTAPLGIAHGGTGMGSFGPGIVMGGLNSNSKLQGLPLTNLTSNFLAGDGIFRIPVNPGGTVQSVAVTMTSEFSITGSPVLGSGTIDIGIKQPISVAHGGTGLGSFGAGIVLGGLTSTGPLQGLPFPSLTSNFLAGDGVFRIPVNPGGTVQSVSLTMTSEFAIQRTPITGSGTIDIGFKQPLAIAHGGTGMGSFAANSIMQMGASSTAPMTSIVLPNLTSNFLRGDGVFGVPPTPTGGTGTVTSVALQLSSEFNVTGSPVTAAGTLMASWAFQAANTVLAGPSGTPSNTPAFRTLVNADIPQSMSGKTMSSSTFQNPTISSQLLAFGSTIAWNMNSGTIALLGMDSTVVGMMATPANLPAAGSAILRIMQLGTGLPSIGWATYWKFESGTKPTLSSGYGNIDVISIYMESGAGYGVPRKKFS